ncbi:hypothetical protein AYO49_00625 [Verrucomicrobiaceae bacterium SCGC AG-212-N21]|nr:hypothetical protein AYO49_00625 [Verrucomicrobiaceae bacterium SCGC AG-212-N21]
MILAFGATQNRASEVKDGEVGAPFPVKNVVVSTTSFQSKDPHAVVSSNVSFLNHLFKEHFKEGEVSRDALRSYYVDYYVAQILNGGFSQFVYNSRWNAHVIQLVREGLQAMSATEHLKLFEESAKVLDKLSEADLKKYLERDYFGENPQRDALNDPSDKFMALMKTEDLYALNGKWLRSLPHLTILSIEDMQAEIDRRAAAMPNREARVAEALASEPRFQKIIRALCARSGQKLSDITAGNPSHVYQGQRVLAWHFITDKGHHYMVETGGKALMFNDESDKPIADVDAPAPVSK